MGGFSRSGGGTRSLGAGGSLVGRFLGAQFVGNVGFDVQILRMLVNEMSRWFLHLEKMKTVKSLYFIKDL